ncbi:uncharacterized protein BX663DRAFT_483955 [Cokeromyces recurvatus]|uniref:uncharacterized protein n=1 Tax=Cokeromyces recurvatus TaxID=90255 RepID=UPI00221E795C|nr:uncharacterized protein BX663DRAFT_483955 [Cokeromyces recurvatus]KAI7905438.1 hypothetical protein BX663DRAFT_483955 [Cokeromyces recurvatus]
MYTFRLKYYINKHCRYYWQEVLELKILPEVKGYSHYVTAVCVEMAMIYANNIVECFETRLKSYILHNIAKKFEKPDKGILKKITHMYCYQSICGGTSPTWPDDLPRMYNNKKFVIDDICKELADINMPKPVTLQNLSKSLGVNIPMLT